MRVSFFLWGEFSNSFGQVAIVTDFRHCFLLSANIASGNPYAGAAIARFAVLVTTIDAADVRLGKPRK